jgi:hypothetical protein
LPTPRLSHERDHRVRPAAAIWAEDWALSYLQDYYGNLVWLFHAAATDREPILVWLD